MHDALQKASLSLEEYMYGQPSFHLHQEQHGTWTSAKNIELSQEQRMLSFLRRSLDDPTNSLKHKAAQERRILVSFKMISTEHDQYWQKLSYQKILMAW